MNNLHRSGSAPRPALARAGWSLFVAALLAQTLGLFQVTTAEIPLRFQATTQTVDEADTVVRLQVLRADDSDRSVTVDYFTAAGTATPGSDYAPVSGTLTFQPGEHFKLIEVALVNDGQFEQVEAFRVLLTNATFAAVNPAFGAATITIRDNDPGFSFQSSLYGIQEPGPAIELHVNRGNDGPGNVSVDYTVEADTALAGVDYLPVTGTLVFSPTNFTQTIRVPIIADSLREDMESFRVALSNPTGGIALRSPSTATVRIFDNDQGFSLSPGPNDAGEAQESFGFSIYRGSDVSGVVSVNYATVPVSATPDQDYIPASGTVTFGAGQFQTNIYIRILNDGLREPTESFRVVLSDPSPGTFLGSPTNTLFRIQDNDSGFAFTEGTTYAVEESHRTVSLTVARGTDVLEEVSVEYSVEAVSATPNQDYTPSAGKLVFPAEIPFQTIQIPILADGVKEGLETFRVALTNASPGVSLGVAKQMTVRITDNDPGFALDRSTYEVSEAGQRLTFYINRGNDSPGEARVGYSLQEGSGLAGVDYAAVNGTVTFQEGESYRTVEVPIINDALREPVETFRIILQTVDPGDVLGGLRAATVRIIDNDPGFHFGAASMEIFESSAGGEVSLTVYRGTDVRETVSVDYAAAPISAIPGLDYSPVQGTLRFAPEEIFKTITVPILPDNLAETTEVFRVTLSNPSGGAFLASAASVDVRIRDNDLGFAFECSAADPLCGSFREGNAPAKVDVIIRGDFMPTNEVSIEFFTEPASAFADVDYISQSGTLVFAPGETRKTISIPILNDGVFEGTETFRLALRNAVGVPLNAAVVRFVFNIQDNEAGYRLEPNTPEGRFIVDENGGVAQINILREGEFNYSTSVDFRTSDAQEAESSAFPEVDFERASGTVIFGPGETNKLISIRIIDDALLEVGEQFFITLSNPTGGIPIANPTLWVDIAENEQNPISVDPEFNPAVYYTRGDFQNDANLKFLPDGRLVVVTPLWRQNGEDGSGIVRLNRDGSADPAFRLANATGFSTMAVQPRGQVLLGGSPEIRVNGQVFRQLARLREDGSIDSSFFSRLPTNSYVTALAVALDGKILAAIDSGRLLRLNVDGTVDSSFAKITSSGSISRVALDQHQRLVVMGSFSALTINDVEFQRPGLARLLPGGPVDQTFLADWKLGWIYGFEIEPDASVLIRIDDPRVLGRLTSEGLLDPAFNPDPAILAYLNFFAPAGDRKVFISTGPPGNFSPALAGIVFRLNADGSVDESLDSGTFTVSFGSLGTWGSAYSLSAETPKSLLLKGDVAEVNGVAVPGLARLLLDQESPRIVVAPRSARVYETNQLVALTLVRTGDSSASLTVNWATGGGSARPNVDYLPTNGTVTFAAGKAESTVFVSLLDNVHADPDRTVQMLFTSTAGADWPQTEFTIVNDDLGFTPDGSHLFPNGRVLLSITGQRVGTNLRFQRSQNFRDWEDYGQVITQNEVLDYGVSDPPFTRYFYRLVRE